MTKKRRRKKRRLKKIPVIILFLITFTISALIFNACSPQSATTPPVSTKVSTNSTSSNNNQNYCGYDVSEYSITTGATEVKSYKRVKLKPNQLSTGDLILVNAAHPLKNSPSAKNLVQVNSAKNNYYLAKDNSVYLATDALKSFNKFMADAHSLKGINDIIIWSGYRSLAEQKKLYETNSSGEDTETSDTAAPGASEHHTGLALDMGIYQNKDGKGSSAFLTDPTYSWISKNAYKYGFIQRYTAEKSKLTGIINEPWHYRFVGLPHSIIMTAQAMCLEEYITYLKSFPYAGNHLKIKLSSLLAYEIYYTKPSGLFTSSIHVPANYEYQISGDNQNGYIITVDLTSKTTS